MTQQRCAFCKSPLVPGASRCQGCGKIAVPDHSTAPPARASVAIIIVMAIAVAAVAYVQRERDESKQVHQQQERPLER